MMNPAALPAQDRLLAERGAAQLLSGPPARTAEAVAGRLLAIQGQDPRGARLAIRARSTGLTAADVDRALTVDRTLVVGWLNRGTLHLARSVDYWLLHQLTTPPLHAVCARRLAQEGIQPAQADRGAAVIERALTDDGPLTRAQLGGRLSAAGLPTAGQALVYLLYLAGLRGISVRGPVAGREQAYVLARDWVGAPAALDRDAALGWLARRYLAGHGPATERDLAKWSGLPLRDIRRGLASVAAGLAERHDGLISLDADGRAGGGAPAELPPARLLGAFDPLLHGWQSRAAVLGRHERVIVQGGMFRPFAMVRGRAVGTWGLPGGQVVLTELDDLTAVDRAALASDAADVTRFLGLPQPAG
ncbi:MAG TPA: winged helix DNA-binding domain-containing protein [Streptosporangiaceae bacterium]|nr:winged helix DNA-binding domain-containing protein [Streptosporangiaceae bacterium]